MFVASFSEERDSLSQWRAYCPSGAGYSIGFDARNLWAEAFTQGFHKFAPCIYDWESQLEAIESLLDKVMTSERWAHVLENRGDEHSYLRAQEVWLREFLLLAPALKHRAFREEREWRLISQPIEMLDSSLRYRAGRSMLIPYVEINLAVYGSHITVKQWFLGF